MGGVRRGSPEVLGEARNLLDGLMPVQWLAIERANQQKQIPISAQRLRSVDRESGN